MLNMCRSWQSDSDVLINGYFTTMSILIVSTGVTVTVHQISLTLYHRREFRENQIPPRHLDSGKTKSRPPGETLVVPVVTGEGHFARAIAGGSGLSYAFRMPRRLWRGDETGCGVPLALALA